MDINQMEVLLAVARERSFSRAAKILKRSQPAISQSIGRLEKDLGEILFDRSSKDGTLTPAGELLVDYARQMVSLREYAKDAVRDLRGLQRGRVSISANEHTVFYLLPLITEYRKRFPAIKIEVHRGVASRIPAEITNREVEIGVLSFKPTDNSVKYVSAVSDSLIMIVSPDHKLAGKSKVSIKELGTENFIAHNARSPYRRMVIEAFEKHRTPLNITIELPSLEAIKRLVESGVGVALVPRLTAEAEIAAGTLKGIAVKEIPLERRLYLVYRRNSELSYAAKEFLNIAREMSA